MIWGIDTARRGALAVLFCAAVTGAALAEAPAAAVPPMPPMAPAPQAADVGPGQPGVAGDAPLVMTSGAIAPVGLASGPLSVRPRARNETVPHARWAHRAEARLWTRAALSALGDHGAPLVRMVPGDIGAWCPAYPSAGPEQRAAFWVGFMSALTKHESTYRPDAVGGGGLWYGLLQILPATARGYGCRARSGEALKNGAANLSCAVRIMARTVPRDGVIHAYSAHLKRKWRGVSADWGPMRSASKRGDMAAWLRGQEYCRPLSSLRPRLRPEGLVPG